MLQVTNIPIRSRTPMVWTSPISLAAGFKTHGPVREKGKDVLPASKWLRIGTFNIFQHSYLCQKQFAKPEEEPRAKNKRGSFDGSNTLRMSNSNSDRRHDFLGTNVIESTFVKSNQTQPLS